MKKNGEHILYNLIMQTRQKRILEILKEKKSWITGKELSTMLSVSDRTIRNDMESLRKECEGLIESSVRYGYRINREALRKNDPGHGSPGRRKGIPQTSGERCKYIIEKLLFSARKLNIFDLQYDIYVSEFTIKNDMKKVSEMLEKYEGVELVRTDSHIFLKGSEECKRSVYKDLLANETRGNFININKIDELFPNFDLIKVKNTLEEILGQYHYRVREETFPMLMIHVGVSIQRMMNCNYVETDRCRSEIRDTKEYQIAMAFFTKVTASLCFDLNENEVVLFANLLIGRQRSTLFDQKKEYLVQAEELMVKIISTVRQRYDIDFSGDVIFKDGIVLHLQNLLERIRYRAVVSNVCLTEIKKTYPLVFEMSVFIGHVIEKYTGSSISEDEIGFLAIHLGAAYDRLNIKYFYHVVLIQPNSNTLTGACSDKILERFGERIVIDAVLKYYEASVIEKLRPDLIISTIPLTHKLDIPMISISMFVNTGDEYKIFRAIAELDKRHYKTEFDNFIKCLILQDYYFYHLECDTWEDVISYMCNRLYEGGRVEESFQESTFARERMAFTSFSYGYAIPHALNYSAIHSTMSIAILKKPVQWGEYQVRLVLLLAVRDDERELLKIFFDWLGNICDDTLLLSKIMKAESAEAFVGLIE